MLSTFLCLYIIYFSYFVVDTSYSMKAKKSNNAGDGTYRCEACNFETKYSQNLQAHFKTLKHLGNELRRVSHLFRKSCINPSYVPQNHLTYWYRILVVWKNTYIKSRSMGDLCKCKQYFWTLQNSFFHKL